MKKYSSITRVNSHRTSQTKRWLHIALLLTAALLILWLIPKVVGTVTSVVLTPIHIVENWLVTSSGRIPSYLRDRNALITEIEGLQAQLDQSSAADAEVAALWWENKELRQLYSESDSHRILAGIIARPNVTPYDVLIIDRGSSAGIEVKAPVYAASTTVIGYVKNVFPESAVVELITTPGFSTSVFVYGPNIYTNAEGMGGGVLRVGVPQGIALTVGNPVIIPSVALGVFGTITSIESEPTSPEQFGYVTSGIPLQSLRLVSVGSAPQSEVAFETAREQVSETIDTFFKIAIPDAVLVDIESEATSTPSSTLPITATSTEND